MGNCCCRKRGNLDADVDQADQTHKIDEVKVDRSSFIMQKNEKFKDNYLIGQSMGCGIYGEVRKCKS